jgi:hypothetical protein
MVLIWMLSSFELSVFSNGKVYDKYGKHVEFYTDVPQILEDLLFDRDANICHLYHW